MDACVCVSLVGLIRSIPVTMVTMMTSTSAAMICSLSSRSVPGSAAAASVGPRKLKAFDRRREQQQQQQRRNGGSSRVVIVRSERSFVMIKPDGVQRGLVSEIVGRFERKGFRIQGLKMFQCSEELAKEHYKVLDITL